MLEGGALWRQTMSGRPLAGEICCWLIKADSVALHYPRKVYIEKPGALVWATDLIEEVKEEESEIEIDSVNLEEQASSTKGRKR